jgi:signal transduction histidine kinase/CheY-like chemotaxis protein
VTHRLDVAGRPWTIAFAPAAGFSRSFPWLAPIALIAGTLLSLAVFGVSLVQLRAWTQVRASEDALRRSESRLRELVDLERDAREEAQAANRAKDEFLATLSHELRTPLNAMLGWLSMLRSGKLASDRRDNALEVVERNALTQARLIEDLLDVSRIMTGKVRLDLHPLQLGPIANTVLEALRPSADAKGVRLHTSIGANVPNLMGDAARLQQIVWNLLSNAIKFTPPGGDVYFDLQAQRAHVELRVRDTGIGIAPEFLPHVFERFRQANSSTTRVHGGVGLGLAIVRHLVELHGGAIEAHSDGRDRGALFVARFPATSSRDASRTTPPQEQHGPVLEGVRVLVVEDDADTRELLTQALSASGASVLPAGSADEALELLRRRGVDVLVSDIGMPDVDGYALLRRVRTLPEPAGRVPAVALTAYARPQDRDDAIDAGFQIHIAKPVQIDALEEALVSLTRHGDR